MHSVEKQEGPQQNFSYLSTMHRFDESKQSANTDCEETIANEEL